MPSIYEVAQEAGVSASTVSRTFNTPHLINPKTKQRVLEVAQRMNYRPPRSRHTGVETASDARTAHAIGFQFFSEWASDTLQGNAFYSNVLAGALAEASDLGLRLMLSTTHRHDLESPLPSMVRDDIVAGLLLVGVADDEVIARFTDRIPHVIFIDHRDPTGKHDAIVSDNFGGARTAAEFLIGLGHRRIGFVTSDENVDSFNERLDGYVSAHYWAGLPVDTSLIVHRPLDDVDVSGRVRAALDRSDRPTAIMTANDILAFNVMRACHSLGMSIPKDLSLIGFDDIQFSQNSIPPLTSVRVQTELLGRLGVRRLYTRLTESSTAGAPALPTCSLVPVKLIERESTKALHS